MCPKMSHPPTMQSPGGQRKIYSKPHNSALSVGKSRLVQKGSLMSAKRLHNSAPVSMEYHLVTMTLFAKSQLNAGKWTDMQRTHQHISQP